METTQLFKSEKRKGSSNKQTESERQKWVSEIADKYYTISNVPLSIQILTIAGQFDKISADTVARELIQRNDIDPLKQQTFALTIDQKHQIKIYMNRLPNDPILHPEFISYRKWTVANSSVGWVSPFPSGAILNKIDIKSKKIPKYKFKFDKNILVIVINGLVGSGMFDDVPENMQVPDNGFSSIYIAHYPKKVTKIWP
ncbi:MAG: hypothetical protein KJ921_06345 [Proteobacteria bacterium]|nr:hypothetical protein [Pseudomonadota bacterium]